MHDRSRAPLQDALVAVRLCGTLEETEPRRRGNCLAHLATAAEMAERFRDHPEAVAETAGWPSALRFDLTRDLGYRYPGVRGSRRRPGAGGDLPGAARASLRGHAPSTPEATRRLEDELAVIRGLGLSGFFLLHYDLLELAREVAVEVRGPRLGADAAAARAAGAARASARSSAT